MENKKKDQLRCPGIEPGSTAWKAAMLTTIPTSLGCENIQFSKIFAYNVATNICVARNYGTEDENAVCSCKQCLDLGISSLAITSADQTGQTGVTIIKGLGLPK